MQNTFEQGSPEYISVGFAAKRCGVSNTTVLRWITTGQLLAFRLPAGHYRICRGDFVEFLTKYSIPLHQKGETTAEIRDLVTNTDAETAENAR